MADTNEGQTESPVKTVEPLEPMDEIALAELLKESLAGDDEPEPQPEELKEESESPDDPPADVEEKEEGEDVLSQEEETTEAEAESTAELTPEQQEKFNKRIGKEVRKRKEQEEAHAGEVAALNAELEEARAGAFAPQPTGSNPFSGITTLEELAKLKRGALDQLEWTEDNPMGGVLTTKEGDQELDEEGSQNLRRWTNRALREHIPAQVEFIQKRDSLEPEVLEAYPWWKDKASSDYQNAKLAMRQFPGVQNEPNYKLIIGDAMAGQALRMSKGKKPEQKKAVPKAPDQPTTPASQPAPVDPTAARSAAAMEEFRNSSGIEELTKVFAAQEKL
jgi:hypothetical protein